jgi:hypothetical protein
MMSSLYTAVRESRRQATGLAFASLLLSPERSFSAVTGVALLYGKLCRTTAARQCRHWTILRAARLQERAAALAIAAPVVIGGSGPRAVRLLV